MRCVVLEIPIVFPPSYGPSYRKLNFWSAWHESRTIVSRDPHNEWRRDLHHYVGRVSDRYSDATNNRTLMREEISRADNWLYYGNEGWAHWIWQPKNGVRASIPAFAKAIQSESPKHSIIGYESCIFGRRFLFLLWNILRQDFCTIGKLQDPAAARLTFVVVAALGVEGCRCMLSGSLPQWSDSKFS